MMTLNHGLSGYVCARAAMPLFRRLTQTPESSLAWACLLGAMLPDGDAVMNLLGPDYYFSGAWYGHRRASHSILGTLVLALLAALPMARFHARRGVRRFRSAYASLVPAFWAGGLLHLVGDVVTPRRPLPLFWPLDFEYGALSQIGWFSPYLLWLFLAAITVELLLRWTRRRARGSGAPALSGWRGHLVWGVHLVAAWRWITYLIESRYESNEQWWAYQHSLLPAALVDPLAFVVSSAWYWMTH